MCPEFRKWLQAESLEVCDLPSQSHGEKGHHVVGWSYRLNSGHMVGSSHGLAMSMYLKNFRVI